MTEKPEVSPTNSERSQGYWKALASVGCRIADHLATHNKYQNRTDILERELARVIGIFESRSPDAVANDWKGLDTIFTTNENGAIVRRKPEDE